MQVPVVAVDVDETLVFGLSEYFIQWLPGQGIAFNHEAYEATSSWEKAIGKPSSEITPLYEGFMQSEDCPPAHPMPGAHDALQILRLYVRLIVSTARGPATKKKTSAELEGHFGPVFDNWYFGCLGCKAAVMRKEKSEVLIEDSWYEARRVVETLPDAYVIKFPNARYDLNGKTQPHRRIITVQAAQRLQRVMEEAEHAELFTAAWQEVVILVQELTEKRRPHCRRKIPKGAF